MKKDVVYIDNDDEIASITDKVQSSPEKIVALVLPKRCTVLQSSVNMKILNKAAVAEGKKLVLITSEAGLLPLAGAAGLFVAKTLQSKPVVPKAPQIDDAVESVVDGEEPDPELDESKSIGELAGDEPDDDAPIELGDDPEPEEAEKPKKEKKDKKLAVPNFDSFRLKLFAGICVFLFLCAAIYMMFFVMPKATVVVKTQYKSVPITLTATGSTTATTTDTKAGTVPLQSKTIEKTETKKFSATGEKDNGTKATGKVVFYNCNVADKLGDIARTVPAGTGISNGGLTFITQSDATVMPSGFTGSTCKLDKPSGEVSVTAQNAGDKYNVSSGRTFSVAGLPSMSATNSSGMGGGTSKITKVVSATDCENAKNELLNANTDATKAELESQLKAAGQTPLPDTFAKTSATAFCNPGVDAEATESTATAQFKFSMSGVSTEGLTQLITDHASSQLTGDEKVYDTGIESGKITVKEKKANGDVVFEFTSTAKVGVKQESQVIVAAVAGKKYGDSIAAVKQLSGVSDVTITYSPFWVRSTPKNPSKITVKFESQDVSTKSP